MFKWGKITRAAATGVLLVAGSVAQAATLGDYEAKPGVVNYTGIGTLTQSGSTLTFDGTGTGGVAPPATSDAAISADVSAGTGTLDLDLVFPDIVVPPNPLVGFPGFTIPGSITPIFDSVTLHDVQSSTGMVTFLFETLFPVAGPGFSGFVIAEVTNAGIAASLIDDLKGTPPLIDVTYVASGFNIYEAQAVNVIPLPASSLLLIAGVGGLVAMRRRNKKAA